MICRVLDILITVRWIAVKITEGRSQQRRRGANSDGRTSGMEFAILIGRGAVPAALGSDDTFDFLIIPENRPFKLALRDELEQLV
ncbi:hypothetical protein E2C01_090258 [Portunus trituberculatus]|uniref:Uncharacterized protein n=1 Tax=Portunus trituberculatus TaxID=210409 RepID=A0A5B7JKX9_PORTR|nr:hypothetical protein [Portunus trituberculatus]